MWSRIWTSSRMYFGNSFFPTYQLDFQSWMTPTRRPPGCTFWPIRPPPPSSSRASASASQRSADGLGGSRGLGRRRRGGARLARLAGLRILCELDRDVARALENLVDAAAGARAPALQRRALVGVGGLHDQVVAVPVQERVRLGVGDGRAQHLLDVLGGRALREREDRPRLGHAAPADVREHDPRLARREADPLGLRAHDLLRLSAVAATSGPSAPSPAGRRRGPRKVRVGANSPSLCPTICSLTKTGTCLRPSWTAIVCPTMSGKIVDERDQVRIIRFSLAAFMASIRLISRSSTKGPFFDDLLTSACPSRGDGRERSACWIPCACGACACRAWARPTG